MHQHKNLKTMAKNNVCISAVQSNIKILSDLPTPSFSEQHLVYPHSSSLSPFLKSLMLFLKKQNRSDQKFNCLPCYMSSLVLLQRRRRKEQSSPVETLDLNVATSKYFVIWGRHMIRIKKHTFEDTTDWV